jgi:hypothetical protein
MMLLCMKTNSSIHGVVALTLLMMALLLKEVHIPAATAPPAPQLGPHVPTLPPKQESINAQSSARTMAAREGLTCPPISQCHPHAPNPRGCCNYQQPKQARENQLKATVN